MKATIEGKVQYKVGSFAGPSSRKIILNKPIPFTKYDGSINYLDNIYIPSDMDDFMETIFNRIIEYDEEKPASIKITIELDDSVLTPPSEWINPIIRLKNKFTNK